MKNQASSVLETTDPYIAVGKGRSDKSFGSVRLIAQTWVREVVQVFDLQASKANIQLLN